MAHRNLREHSKATYISTLQQATIEEIAAGSLQRIADATEKMAMRHIELIDNVDRYRRWWEEEKSRRCKLERSNAALRGQITRLKKLVNVTWIAPSPTPSDREQE